MWSFKQLSALTLGIILAVSMSCVLKEVQAATATESSSSKTTTAAKTTSKPATKTADKTPATAATKKTTTPAKATSKTAAKTDTKKAEAAPKTTAKTATTSKANPNQKYVKLCTSSHLNGTWKSVGVFDFNLLDISKSKLITTASDPFLLKDQVWVFNSQTSRAIQTTSKSPITESQVKYVQSKIDDPKLSKIYTLHPVHMIMSMTRDDKNDSVLGCAVLQNSSAGAVGENGDVLISLMPQNVEQIKKMEDIKNITAVLLRKSK